MAERATWEDMLGIQLRTGMDRHALEQKKWGSQPCAERTNAFPGDAALASLCRNHLQLGGDENSRVLHSTTTDENAIPELHVAEPRAEPPRSLPKGRGDY